MKNLFIFIQDLMNDSLYHSKHAKSVRPLDPEVKQVLLRAADTIRELTMDATQKARSGHPGLPMGCAEIGAYLYGIALQHSPKNPHWANRDRFILSGGHGSMLLYSCLHLAGFNLSIDDIKQFRQLHSLTPGLPEETIEGVEATTGPLGQGVGNGIGLALGLKLLAERFNTDAYQLFDSKVYVLMTDGDMMEGASSEASALAGHLQLDNLILLYDDNQVSLDGPLSQSSSENTQMRYEAYGWDVVSVDGNDLDAIHQSLFRIRSDQKRPTLVICHTVIGKGAPNKAGTHQAHGCPLGQEEVEAAKEALGFTERPFYVPQVVYDFFEEKAKQGEKKEHAWKRTFEQWAAANPDLHQEYEGMKKRSPPDNLENILWDIPIENVISGRKASHLIIQKLGSLLPYLYGGSADLSGSDMTMMEQEGVVGQSDFRGKNIKFGVREFAMATMATGLEHTGMILPFIGTFLIFSDYMRNAIRLCSLMRGQVIYHFTHDSLLLGEDGPTHQPVEHLASLRAIPNLQVIRPGDANEVRMAWVAALFYKGPTALVLSRQNLQQLDVTRVPYNEGMGRGAYIVKQEERSPDYTLVATGSELSLALEVSAELEKHGKSVRVISMPCWELFDGQTRAYQTALFGGDLGQRVSIEAGSELGWHKYIGKEGIAICMDRFGASGPQDALAEEFGFTVDLILERIL